ncbi:MAG: LPS export ABC transporter periplasmic protein LptC [Endomicrobium sp.]|jgi:LPS export ABC transporter protein LptC|nr:LPS export ABC transporter periplasmic protein LptC [Endomicrobium sp.]
MKKAWVTQVNFYKLFNIYVSIIFFIFLIGCKAEKTVVEETLPIPEQAIEKFTIIQTDEGKLKIIMDAESAVIDESGNIAHVRLPSIKFYNKGDYVSTLVAESADVNMKTHDIKCIGKCVISSAKNECVQTTNLIYDAGKDLIYSNNDVRITRPRGTIYGASFKSDTKFDRIIIKNQRTVID